MWTSESLQIMLVRSKALALAVWVHTELAEKQIDPVKNVSPFPPIAIFLGVDNKPGVQFVDSLV